MTERHNYNTENYFEINLPLVPDTLGNGATVSTALSELQINKVMSAINDVNISTNLSASGNNYVFFASFDGTENDSLNNGNPSVTNVRELYRIVNEIKSINPKIETSYQPGAGSKEASVLSSSYNPIAVTADAFNKAKNVFEEFSVFVEKSLSTNPEAEFQIVTTSFSRGCTGNALFAQMLFEKGITSTSGEVLIPPGELGIDCAIMFDPVATGFLGSLWLPPTTGEVINLVAMHENRVHFKNVDFSDCVSGDMTLTTYPIPGNHCDIGGSYNKGISNSLLERIVDQLIEAGLPLDKSVSAMLSPEGAHREFLIHSEVSYNDGYSNMQSWPNEFMGASYLRMSDSDFAQAPTQFFDQTTGQLVYVLKKSTYSQAGLNVDDLELYRADPSSYIVWPFEIEIEQNSSNNLIEINATAYQLLTLKFKEGADLVDASGSENKVVLEGGRGDDVLTGSSFKDTFIYSKEDGFDTLKNNSTTTRDLLVFKDLNSSEVHYFKQGDDLLVFHSLTDRVLIKDWFNSKHFEGFKFANGEFLSHDVIESRIKNSTTLTDQNDILTATRPNDVIFALEGNDLITTGNPVGTSIEVFAGQGNDHVRSGGGSAVFYGEAGSDVLYGGLADDYLNGGAGDDVLDGGVGSNILIGGEGNDKLGYFSAGSSWAHSMGYNSQQISLLKGNFYEGGKGADHLRGTVESDTYMFSAYDGEDILEEASGSKANSVDKIIFDITVNPFDFNVFRDSYDLVLLNTATNDKISIKNWFSTFDGTFKIEEVQFQSTQTTWNSATLTEKALESAVSGHIYALKEYPNLVLKGKETSDTFYTLNSSNIVYAGAGDDVVFSGIGGWSQTRYGGGILHGQEGNDRLGGGRNKDFFYGGSGDDILGFQSGTGHNEDSGYFSGSSLTNQV